MFRITNASMYDTTVSGISISHKSTVDLSASLDDGYIISSLMSGDLYSQIQGRILYITHPASDINSLELTTSQFNFLAQSGFLQGNGIDGTLNTVPGYYNGVVVDTTSGDVSFSPSVQLFVTITGTLKYDDAAGHTAQSLSAVPAGFAMPWKVSKVYKTGTSAVLVAIY
jgi:hypothetical protein